MKEELEKLLAENEESIKAAVKAQLTKGLIESLRYSLREEIAEVTEAFVKTEIVPAIAADLQKSKAEIIQKLHTGIVGSAAAIGKAMQAKIKENVSGYRFSRVLEELLK